MGVVETLERKTKQFLRMTIRLLVDRRQMQIFFPSKITFDCDAATSA